LWFVPAMNIGGDAYTREVVVKQTAGRAVGSWVHKAAPWFYVTHAPGDLFPWFFLFVVALIAIYKRRDEAAKFYVSWMLAVFVPYTLMSSKLDIYMMALLPPAALLIAQMLNAAADKYTRWAWRANQLVIGLLLGIGVAGVFAAGTLLKGPEAEVVSLALVRGLFVVLALAAAVALIASTRSRDAITSTIAAGLVPIAALVYLAIALVPTANDLASTRPLVHALQKQNVDAREISLFSTPQLWIRGMPRDLENVTYMSRSDPARGQVIVTSRRYADDIRAQLSGYRKVDEFRMIGKWFDVYRR
jgi:4-amino-4-deoxy-L-arabinose transferase-like glycosyltransferase